MQALRVVPKIFYFDTFREFNEEFKIGSKDVLVTNQWMYRPYVEPLDIKTNVIYQEAFGMGEPSDEMIDAMAEEMKKYDCDRIIAFGGGTIVDICKILALDIPEKSQDLFTGTVKPKKLKKVVVVPTTCGTGSEVTNVAIAELKSLHTKKGIAAEETFADMAVLIPECLDGLPDKVFATSSIDALIHAAESYLSPKASSFTEMYSLKAMEMILDGYKNITATGNNREARKPFLKDFLLASNYAGIAFGNAGCAAVHALSYSIGGTFHVPHGEANYQFFTEVFKMYMRKAPEGKIALINQIFADILNCPVENVYEALECLLNQLISRKPLREYGMTKPQIHEFTKMTVENQQRLLANNYVSLTNEEIRQIFANLY
ncbi:4-hydroxybutyrate dehydrogenase [Aminipila terrae]|uniref:Iron-containing alcohol dehydrogenase n=1 Tax=Aminipila terrae TaxID=2697030 RepID=A0A6P1MKQ3_9FIRM|nr:4-hydroxybutyrate dehydrogenase [Aminipila terrae]QHI73254.1 iron-containing alcohol dehydrogenase [Aminipila terrae]